MALITIFSTNRALYHTRQFQPYSHRNKLNETCHRWVAHNLQVIYTTYRTLMQPCLLIGCKSPLEWYLFTKVFVLEKYILSRFPTKAALSTIFLRQWNVKECIFIYTNCSISSESQTHTQTQFLGHTPVLRHPHIALHHRKLNINRRKNCPVWTFRHCDALTQQHGQVKKSFRRKLHF